MARKLEHASYDFHPNDMVLTNDNFIGIVGNANSDRAFIIKLDTSGNFVWCYIYYDS